MTHPGHWRMLSLSLFRLARCLADGCAGGFLLHYAVAHGQDLGSGFLLALAWTWPAVIAGCLIGDVVSGVSHARVLRWSALYGVGVVLLVVPILLGMGPETMSWAWPFLTVGWLMSGSASEAQTAAAAEEANRCSGRWSAVLTAGSMALTGLGLYLAWDLGTDSWSFADVPPVLLLAAALNLLAWALAWHVPTEALRPVRPRFIITWFYRDGNRLWRHGDARRLLLTHAFIWGVLAILVSLILRPAEGSPIIPDLADVADKVERALWLLGGLSAGSLLTGLGKHPRRVAGLVPYALTALAGACLVWALAGGFGATGCFLAGTFAGLAHAPLVSVYQVIVATEGRGNAMVWRRTVDLVSLFAGAFLVVLLHHKAGFGADENLWLLAGVALALAIFAWVRFLRDATELLLELFLLPLYRIRAHGPGLAEFPLRGPVLVLANHSAWLDPFWVGKVVPRPIIAMMTSVFYDVRYLKPLFQLMGAIRVEAATFRREVPELKEAVATLDRGECLVIFPEGAMRKRDDQPLRLFGQGVIHILKERPQTPVVICWIEGGWGSFFSYWGGQPTKKKRMDFMRRIDIGVDTPRQIDPKLLDDPRAARQHLMHACLEARRHLGLPPLVVTGETADDQM